MSASTQTKFLLNGFFQVVVILLILAPAVLASLDPKEFKRNNTRWSLMRSCEGVRDCHFLLYSSCEDYGCPEGKRGPARCCKCEDGYYLDDIEILCRPIIYTSDSSGLVTSYHLLLAPSAYILIDIVRN